MSGRLSPTLDLKPTSPSEGPTRKSAPILLRDSYADLIDARPVITHILESAVQWLEEGKPPPPLTRRTARAAADLVSHRNWQGTGIVSQRFCEMPRKSVTIEIIEEEDERFLLKTYADGTEERHPIVKEPKKNKRLSAKIAWYWDLKTGRRKFY
jgi:hypothetical protein